LENNFFVLGEQCKKGMSKSHLQEAVGNLKPPIKFRQADTTEVLIKNIISSSLPQGVETWERERSQQEVSKIAFADSTSVGHAQKKNKSTSIQLCVGRVLQSAVTSAAGGKAAWYIDVQMMQQQQQQQVLGSRALDLQVVDQGMLEMTDRYALLIGNSAYANDDMRLGVTRCTNNANAMARTLSCNILGDHKFATQTLLDQTKDGMERRSRDWVKRLRTVTQCVALLEFAGHGMEVNGENFLLPIDVPADMLEGEVNLKCVSLNWFMFTILGQLGRESLVIVLLDCCREETFAWGFRSKRAGKRGLGAVSLSDSDSAAVFVGYAAAPGMCAMERPNRSFLCSCCGCVHVYGYT